VETGEPEEYLLEDAVILILSQRATGRPPPHLVAGLIAPLGRGLMGRHSQFKARAPAERVLEILRMETRVAMALCGAASVKDLSPALVRKVKV
jgi:hypothetical protein